MEWGRDVPFFISIHEFNQFITTYLLIYLSNYLNYGRQKIT